MSTADFEQLSSAERLTYLSDAMEEMERLKVPLDKRGWLTLFSQTPEPQQQQQPQQPQQLQQLQQQQQQQQSSSEPDQPPTTD